MHGLRRTQMPLLVLAFLCLVRPALAERPNILLLLSDDQRVDTISVYGNREIRTPNLDWLVRHGTSMMRAHAAYPLCTASRAEILTGTIGIKNGMFYPFSRQLNPGFRLLPEVLQKNGY